jgi:hypothetical protein
MSERMTSVAVPSAGDIGFQEYGRHTPEEMIARHRRRAQIQLEEAQGILAAPDSEFVVETYLGVIAQRQAERLWPKEATS